MVRRSGKFQQRLSRPKLQLSPAQMSVLQTAVDAASPPDTPSESQLPRQNNQSPFYFYANSLPQDPNIKPYGTGHSFSYRPLEQLSPRSFSSASSEIIKDSSDSASFESLSIASLPVSPTQFQHIPTVAESDSGFKKAAQADSVHPRIQATDATEAFQLTIEDVDPMDSECEDLEVLFPTEIESNRSRPGSRHGDLDRGMMLDLSNLTCSNDCSNETSDSDADRDASEEAFLKRQQELKRIRRVSVSSSFGKRSHSELSDSDDNDGTLDVNEVGSSARRFRKRLHRGSLLFQDSPEPRIEELVEPNSSEDEYADVLTPELPRWQMEMMEMGRSPC